MPDIFVAPPKKEINVSNGLNEPNETKTKQGETETTIIPESKGGSLSAFIAYPESIRFDTQEEREQIVLFLRKHWITNIPWLLVTFFLVLVPSLFFPIVIVRGFLSLVPANFMLVFSFFWYLAAFGFALVNFITWYFNVYIVTNERIIDVDFYQLLYKEMSAARIARVQDLTYKLGGVIRALFDYGDVFIQTAGTELNFDFEAVPHPEQVVRIISELTEKKEEEL